MISDLLNCLHKLSQHPILNVFASDLRQMISQISEMYSEPDNFYNIDDKEIELNWSNNGMGIVYNYPNRKNWSP